MIKYPFFWADICFTLGMLSLTLASAVMYKITKLKRYILASLIIIIYLYFWLNQYITIAEYVLIEEL